MLGWIIHNGVHHGEFFKSISLPPFVWLDFQLLQDPQPFFSIPPSAIIPLVDLILPVRYAMSDLHIVRAHFFKRPCIRSLFPLFSPKAWWLHPPRSHRSLSFLLDLLLPTASGLAKYANVLKCKRSPSFLWPVSQNELLTREDQSLVCFSLFQWSSTTSNRNRIWLANYPTTDPLLLFFARSTV